MKHHCLAFTCLLIMTLSLANPPAGWATTDSPDSSLAVAGYWKPIAPVDRPILTKLEDLCLFEGQIHAVGNLVKPTGERHFGEDPWSVAVWQDSIWVPQDEDLRGNGKAMATDGDRLAIAMQARPAPRTWRRYPSIHLLENGQWRGLGEEILGEVDALAFWRGQLVVGGSFKLEETNKSVNLAIWHDERWQPLGGGVGGVAIPRVTAVEVIDDDLWVAGRFETAGRQEVSNVGIWDGRVWRTLHGGVDDKVVALTSVSDGVVAAGVFHRAGGVATPGLALFDGQDWMALPEFPEDTIRPPIRGPSCPTAPIEALASWQGDLVALGNFTFPVEGGGRVHGAAVLQNGHWRVLPGSETWKSRYWISSGGDAGFIIKPSIDSVATPDNYDPEKLRSRNWIPRVACLNDQELIIGGVINRNQDSATFVARAGHEPGIVSEPTFQMRSPKLYNWRDELLVYGSYRGKNGTRQDLSVLDNGEWKLPGDWAGESSLSGGYVQAATSWRGELVVAGSFHHVADHVVRHVAAFDGENWRPLGDGIPFYKIGNAYLWPRSDDLLLFCTVGSKDQIHPASDATCWRWDDESWTRIALPDSSVKRPFKFKLAGQGDLLWAAGEKPLPDESGSKKYKTQQVMYRLDGTQWTKLAMSSKIRDMAVWNGLLTILQGHSDGQMATLSRWTGEEWQQALDQDLPGESRGLKVTDEALVIACEKVSYAWFDPGWGMALVRDHRQGIYSIFWLSEKAYGIRHRWEGDGILEWVGKPTRYLDGYRPPVPEFKPRRHASRRKIEAMPFAALADNDTLHGWSVWDGGQADTLATVSPLGPAGFRIEGEHYCSVSFRFKPVKSTWYRLTGRVDCPNEKPQLSASLQVSVPDTVYHGYGYDLPDGAFIKNVKGTFEAVVPSPVEANQGLMSFHFYGGIVDIQNLRLEEDSNLLAQDLIRVYEQVRSLWHHPSGRETSLPATMPEALQAKARSTFQPHAAESVVRDLLQVIDDSRFRFEYPWHQDALFSPARTMWDKYPVPISATNCDEKPRGIQAWEMGGLAYVCDYAKDCDDCQFDMPFIHELETSGLILDLRRSFIPLERAYDQVPEILNYLGSDECRWARQRSISGQEGAWCSVEETSGFSKTPVIVLIGPDTRETEALMAEALARMDHVMLLGETTAPMPAVMVDLEMPWTFKVIKVPSGTWEAPGGRTLTDQRVQPDVVWPATDTEGLMDRAREIVAKFQSTRRDQ